MLDCQKFPTLFCGSLKAGIIPVCLNTLRSTEQYRYILNDCRAKVRFVSSELIEVVAPILGEHLPINHSYVVVGLVSGQQSFEQEFANCASGKMVEASADETAFWLYSSGSIGMPMGACMFIQV